MSYLIRTGNGRNNIAWGGSTSTKAKYLRRTGTGRTNISWIDISSNGTYNVLERTGNSRNNIRWYNTQFSFISFDQIFDDLDTAGSNNIYVFNSLHSDNGGWIGGFQNVVYMNIYTIENKKYLITNSNRIYEATSNSGTSNSVQFRIDGGDLTDNDVNNAINKFKQMTKITILLQTSPLYQNNYNFYRDIKIINITTSGNHPWITIDFASSNFAIQSGEYYRCGFRLDP